jgi:hypothetical protein
MAAQTDPMTKKMSASSRTGEFHGMPAPKQGERYRCAKCGMEVQVTKDCRCGGEEHVHFECCGQPLQKA